MATWQRAARAYWLLCCGAAAALTAGCGSAPPPVAFLSPGASTTLTAVTVAAQATVLQAKYGCTVFKCRQGYECDLKTRRCKPRREGPSLSQTAKPSASSKRCVGSADGLITLCVAPDTNGTFQIQAQNAGPTAVVLSLRELSAKSAQTCTRSGNGHERLSGAQAQTGIPTAKPLGLRFLAMSNAALGEPRSALFLSPGPPNDLEVVFELEGQNECDLELTATFEVSHGELSVVATVPPSAPQ